jgi:hypothetical protein
MRTFDFPATKRDEEILEFLESGGPLTGVGLLALELPGLELLSMMQSLHEIEELVEACRRKGSARKRDEREFRSEVSSIRTLDRELADLTGAPSYLESPVDALHDVVMAQLAVLIANDELFGNWHRSLRTCQERVYRRQILEGARLSGATREPSRFPGDLGWPSRLWRVVATMATASLRRCHAWLQLLAQTIEGSLAYKLAVIALTIAGVLSLIVLV